jgi:PAS domain S-box-containing protein
MLEILRRGSITVWAADGKENNYGIRLWSPGSERIYGHAREDALGKSYIDLFVNPRERDRAIEDHERMIDTGEVYEWGWSADDIDANGQIRTMLTNCFRVFDSPRNKWILAEIGIDISELDRASQQLRRVQEDALVADSSRKRLLALRAISEIGQAIAELGDDGTLGSVVRTIFDGVRRVVSGTPKSYLWLFGHESTTEYGEITQPHLPFDDREGIALTRRKMEAIFYDQKRENTAIAKLAVRQRRSKTRSFALLPLVNVRDDPRRLSGLLAVTFGDNRIITLGDEEMLRVFATQVGSLLAIATELQRRRREGAKRVQHETKELVIRSVLHTVGNDAYIFQGHAHELIREAEQLGLDLEFQAKLRQVQGAAAQLGDSMKELREQLGRSEHAEALPLVEPVEAVVQPLRLRHRNVNIRVSIDHNLVVTAARGYVRHAVNNVVSNGAQILEDVDGGGFMEVWAERVGDWVELHIEDDGPGVDPDIRDTLFSEGVSRRRGGSGHGLFIATDLIATCGGTVEFLGDSVHYKGAHFIIRLPCGRIASSSDR